MKKIEIIFLYAEITPYINDSFENYLNKNKNISLTVIYFSQKNNLWLKKGKLSYSHVCIDKFTSKFDLLKFCKNLNPKTIFVSGRMNIRYLYVARKLKSTIKIVTVQDTQIDNSVKQFLFKVFSIFLYHRYFNEFWGVGSLQSAFAYKVGFKKHHIHQGFYVCNSIFTKHKIKSNDSKNLKILFIGRLVKEKNILNLSNLIEKINIKMKSFHELIVIGDGILKHEMSKNSSTKLLGIKSQNEIIEIAKICDLFCLPSNYEPWGVVIHEMTSLGLPILCSYDCGGGFDLVINDYNGYKFNDLEEFEISLNKFINLNKSERQRFSINSKTISQKLNHESWNSTLNSLVK
jgi:glycosyltransferase involved in cell wall biosynthesis